MRVELQDVTSGRTPKINTSQVVTIPLQEVKQMTSTRYEQPELPLASASLAEHKRLTGHDPVVTQEGWICTERTGEKRCMSAWPPPGTFQVKFEEAMLDVLEKGHARLHALPEGHEVEVHFNDDSTLPVTRDSTAIGFPVLGDSGAIVKGYN